MPIERVWACWTEPAHITGWTFASNDWEAPAAANDLRVGGRFATRMQAKDGSAGVRLRRDIHRRGAQRLFEYAMDRLEGAADDARRVRIEFEQTPDGVRVSETFDPENVYPAEQQRAGWQAILDNFKKYSESA